MATITASLERSLRNCSLDHTQPRKRGGGRSSDSLPEHSTSSDSPDHLHSHRNHSYHHSAFPPSDSNASSSDENSTFLELNSHISLPYHWEQCLDLKTGEVYYINWSNGMKVREDPRTTSAGYSGDYDCGEGDEEEEDEDEEEEEEEEEEDEEKEECEEEEEEEEEEERRGYESEGSSTESYLCSSSRGKWRASLKRSGRRQHQQHQEIPRQEEVLVVAGCQTCFMYHMVPKLAQLCPKCSGQLLHFPPNPTSSP